MSVLLNNGNGTFAARVDYATRPNPYSVTAADFNGDGKADLAVANYSSNTVSILLNNGNGTFAARVDYATGSYPHSVTAADLNGDGKADLAVANAGSNTVSVLINTTSPALPPVAPALTSPGLSSSPGQVIASSTPTLHWQSAPWADQYGLYVSKLQTNGTYQLIFDSRALNITIPGSATTYTLPSGYLQDGGQYRWNMNSHNASGWGSYSPRLYFGVSSLPAPATPTGVTATPTDPTTVHLAWPAVGNATFYRIYRSTSASGPWNQLVYQQAAAQADDPLLSSDTTYYYRVQASGPGGESGLSAVVSAHTSPQVLPATPTGLQITSSNTSGVNLTWAATLSSGNYVLQRSSDGVHFSTIATLNANQTSYPDTTMAMSTPQVTVQYRMFSEVGGLLSAATSAVETTINAVVNSVAAVSQTLANLVGPPYAGIPQIYLLDPLQMSLLNTTSPVWTLETNLPTDAAFWDRPTIILTHGWNDTFSPTDSSKAPYIDKFASHFVDWGTSSANVFAIDWYGNGSLNGSSPYLQLDSPFKSADNGIAIGTLLAQKFVQAGLQTSKTMLVGHSNGAGLMAAFAIKAKAMGEGPVMDLVALDAPTQTASYGKVWYAARSGATLHVDDYYMAPLEVAFGAPIHLANVTNFSLYKFVGGLGHSAVPLMWGNLTTSANRNQPWDMAVASLITQSDSAASFDAAALWTQGADGVFTRTLTYSESLLREVIDPRETTLELHYAVQQGITAGQSLLQGVHTTLQQTAGGILNWITGQAASPVQGSLAVQIPPGAALLAFDLTVTDSGNDDTLLIAIGNNVIGQVDLAAQKLAGGRIELPISAYGGQSDSLTFYMPSAVSSTAQFTIGNLSFAIPPIPGRFLFYKDSPGFGSISDDTAIATDKTALLPGQSATFANYTSYSRGINGLMIDIANPAGTLTASDFTFKVGGSSPGDTDPSAWITAPAPDGVIIRPTAGIGGSTRVEITWADNAIQNQWLQVTLKGGPGSISGLPADDVFYFGNAIGEAGNDPASARVNAIDELAARAAPTPTASITNPYDYNRDGIVDLNDQLIARTHVTCFLNELQLLTPPAAVVAPAITGVQDSGIAGSVSTTPTVAIDSTLIPVLVAITPTENSGQVGGNVPATRSTTNPIIIVPLKMASAPKPLRATPLVGLAPIGSSAKAITSTLTARSKAISKRQPVKSLIRSSFSKLPIFQRLI